MADAPAVTGVEPPTIGEALQAGWKAFTVHSKVLVTGFAIFLGSVLFLAILFQILAGAMGFITIFLSIGAIMPPLLLVPGLYKMALKAVRGQKPDPRDLLLIFKDRPVHHIGLLLLQTCGALLCVIGAIATQAMFIPGSFMVIDRKMDWDGAMGMCVEQIKPKFPKWILFHLVVAVVAFAGVFGLIVGTLITGPVALCAWAYAYEKAFGGGARA